MARQVFLASRTNFFLSVPLLFFMAANSHTRCSEAVGLELIAEPSAETSLERASTSGQGPLCLIVWDCQCVRTGLR